MNKKKTVLLLLILVLLISMAGYGGNLFAKSKTDSQEKAVNSASVTFIKALLTSDTDKVYALSTADFKKANSKDDIKALSEEIKSNNPGVSNQDIYLNSKDHAIFMANVSHLSADQFGSTNGEFVINLIHTDSGWKVDNANVF